MTTIRRTTKPVRRCDANAIRGTGTGVCDFLLDRHGNCPNASNHVELTPA